MSAICEKPDGNLRRNIYLIPPRLALDFARAIIWDILMAVDVDVDDYLSGAPHFE